MKNLSLKTPFRVPLFPAVALLAFFTPRAEVFADAQAAREVSFSVNGGRLVVRPLLDNALRVRFGPETEKEAPSLVLTETVKAPEFEVDDSAKEIVVRTARMTATIDKSSGAIAYGDASGRVFLRELPGSRRVEASTLRGEPVFAVAQSFDSPGEERLFGTGQFQDGFLNIRDLPRRLIQVNTQIAIPFVLSSRGYGLLWHNYGLTEFNPADEAIPLTADEAAGEARTVDVTTTEGNKRETRQDRDFNGKFTVTTPGRYVFSLDVGQKMARRWQLKIDGRSIVDFSAFWLPPTVGAFAELSAGEHTVTVVGEKHDRPVLTFRPARAATEFRSPVAEAIDYVVFAGQGDEVISAYRQLTGPAPMMPRWALGYVHCRERFRSQAELLSTAAEFRQRKIPFDVIVQDWQYWGRHGWNAMRFDENDYPDPRAMVDTLHKQNARLMVSVWSRIDPKSEVGAKFVERGLMIPDTEWVDFFNPDAARFYWENFSARMVPLGIDGWWLDATEPENDDLAGRRTHAGLGERLRNTYPLFVNRTVYEGLRRDAPDRRPFILTRSAFSGQQRYASVTWSGDIGNSWETLRRQVTAGLDYVVTGLPWWTTDTGGFFRPGKGQYNDAEYHERFLRWLQFSTFTPLMRVHGYQTDTEFWRYGPLVEKESRRWLDLRYRLLPYIYSESAKVAWRGSTLMRPLVFDFPGDAQALDQSTQFMFGPSLLVSPVLEPGAKQWPVYLPKHAGGWFDFWTGQHYQDGDTVSVASPLEKVPLMVRAGSIVPFGPYLQHVGEKPADPIELRIYPGADGAFTLYEDEGDGFGYENGLCSSIPFTWRDQTGTLVIGARRGEFPGMLKTRSFHIVVVGPGAGAGLEPSEALRTVRYDGHAMELRLPVPPRAAK